MAHIVFVTAPPREGRGFWNRQLIARLQQMEPDLKVSLTSWESPELQQLAQSCTHISLLIAAHYDAEMESFTNFIMNALPNIQATYPNIRICNPPQLTAWDINKTYLKDLHDAGILVPASKFLPPGTSFEELRSTLAGIGHSVLTRGSNTVILKPSIGVSGRTVVRIQDCSNLSLDECQSLQRLLDQADPKADIMLQEYIREVVDNGEWSLVYVDNSYVGAFLKMPSKAKGEFRVNSGHGGVAKRVEDDAVPQAAKAVGEQVIQYLNRSFGKDSCGHMRLDGVMRENGDFVLMGEFFSRARMAELELLMKAPEIECIEPWILTEDDVLCSRLAQAFIKMAARTSVKIS